MPGWEKWDEVSREAVEEGKGYFEHPDAPLDDPQTEIDEIDILSKALGVKVVMKATGYEPLDMNELIGEPYFRVRVEKLSDKKFREFAEKYKYEPSGCFIIRFHQIPDAIREMVRYGLLPKDILEDYKKAQEYKKRMITRLMEEYRNTKKEKAYGRV